MRSTPTLNAAALASLFDDDTERPPTLEVVQPLPQSRPLIGSSAAPNTVARKVAVTRPATQNTYFVALPQLAPPSPVTAPLSRPDGPSEHVRADFLVGLSPPTAAAYGRDLRCAFAFLYGIGVPPLQAERRHLEGYARSCVDRGLAPRTTARRMVALNGFLSYAVEQGLLRASPMTTVRRPRTTAPPARRALDLDEARRLLHNAADHSPRAHALVCLLLGTGLRISAVCGLDVGDLCRGTTTTVRYRNKGGGCAITVLTTEVVTTIDAYLAGRADGPLLLSEPTGRRLDRGGAHRLLKRIAATALPDRPDLSAHTLRSTFCQLALQAGVGLQDVSLALAHVNIAHTQPYLAAALQHEHHPAHAVAAALQPLHLQSPDHADAGHGRC